MEASPAESPKDAEKPPEPKEGPSGGTGPSVQPLSSAVGAVGYPKATAYAPPWTAHGQVRMSRSMVIPAEPFARTAPKAWVFQGSGGSLPCAQRILAALILKASSRYGDVELKQRLHVVVQDCAKFEANIMMQT